MTQNKHEGAVEVLRTDHSYKTMWQSDRDPVESHVCEIRLEDMSLMAVRVLIRLANYIWRLWDMRPSGFRQLLSVRVTNAHT